MTQLSYKSANQLAQMILNNEISSSELLEYFIKRVEKYNPSINAIIIKNYDEARKQSRLLDEKLKKGEILGALHGVPMTVKESYGLKNTPTTYGRSDLKDNIVSEDALSIQRLKGSGAVIFGKTNVPLNLADFQSYNDVYGTTNNPWDLKKVPGGSSGGSAAALAAGLTGFETGSDIGGSIRNPAHYCGVFGHKPTWGLLPPRGHALPGVVAQSDLTVIGPMARSAHDLETGVLIMGGPDEIQSAGLKMDLERSEKKSLREYKIASWINEDIAPVNQEVQNRILKVSKTISDAGGKVDFEARPDFDLLEAMNTYQSLLLPTMSSRAGDDEYNLLKERVEKLDPADNSESANTLRKQISSLRDYNRANNDRTHLRWKWHEFFKEYDAIITPVMATEAFDHNHANYGERTIMVDNDERPYFEQVFWAGIAICSYLPSTVIPTGLTEEGLPIGIQIIGPEYGDLKTIGLAKLLEEEGYHFTPPPNYPD
jgi:amidase